MDDNQAIADTLGDLLEALGYGKPMICYHPIEALRLANADMTIDVFILDVGMPDMDGWTLARRLRSQPWHRDALLVAHTAYGSPEDQQRSLAAGFDHHLVKPSAIDVFTDLLDHHRAARGVAQNRALTIL